MLNGGIRLYSVTTLNEIVERLARGGKKLILPPEYPSNVTIAYVTNGAKTGKTVEEDIKAGHPETSIEDILLQEQCKTLEELSERINASRYDEALHSLSYVGARAAVFLEYPSNRIKSEPDKPASDLAALIGILRPEIIFTLSPFEFSHDTHILVSDLTLKAIRLAQSTGYSPLLKGYPVWDPDKIRHNEIVDISEVIGQKLDAIHIHSIFGSQSTYGRRYESIVGLNNFYASELTVGALSSNGFNASMQRPRLPVGIFYVDIFVDMTPLIMNPSMSVRNFVERDFQQTMSNYPVK